MVNATPSVERAASRDSNVGTIMETRRFALRTWMRALRIHQWAKNLIILVPVVTAHQVGNKTVVLNAVLGMVLFSFAASAVYLFNDILDLDSDRQHPVKKTRPLASGELPLWIGLFASLVLFVTAIAGSLLLPYAFLATLCAYFLINAAYSTVLKRRLMVDVICLALLYTIRIIAGHTAAQIKYSTWLLAFALFFFFSLAMIKRFSELLGLRANGQGVVKGRGYLAGDLEPVAMLGISSGSLAVLVLVLYVTSAEVRALYRHPELLLLMAPVMLYWLGRIWTIAHRGQVHEDPVIFALRDKASYAAGALCVAIMIAATL